MSGSKSQKAPKILIGGSRVGPLWKKASLKVFGPLEVLYDGAFTNQALLLFFSASNKLNFLQWSVRKWIRHKF